MPTRKIDQRRGSRILRLMTQQGWSKAHLAREVGAAEGQVYRWIKGEPISSEHLGALAETLGTSRLYIVAGQGPMYVGRERISPV